MPRPIISQFAIAALLAALSATAQADPDRYRECIALVNENPDKARETAAQWAATGGGGLARHCAAIALIAQGAELAAAEELTRLGAEGGGIGEADRVSALMLAGDLWLRNGQTTLAGKVFERAALLAPDAPDPLVGQAKAAAAEQSLQEADALLTAALELDPNDAEALTLRAAARRSLGDPAAALVDAQSATERAPDAALAWFERGAAERGLEAKDAARESWLRAIALDPDGEAGELARVNLQRMELGLDGPD